MPQVIRQFVFQGAHSTTLLACHLFAVAAAVFLIVLLSRYERKLVPRPVGLGLLGLRLAVLAVILLTLLQPTLTWSLQQQQSSRILVGIDVSQSMSTLDQHATKAEKLRVARGLELIGNTSTKDRLNRWQKSFDLNQEPDWIDPDEAVDVEQRAPLVDSRKENLLSVFSEIDKFSRREIALRLLIATKDPLLDRLKKLHRVELFVFAGKVESTERELLAKVVTEPSSSILTETTDLSLGLQPGSNGVGDVLGTILFTDGRDHSRQNLPGMAASLKSANSPVYPILIGSSYRPKDLSIQQIEHPQSAYKGDHPQLKVTLGTSGFDGQMIDVELVSDDEPQDEPIRQTVKCTKSTVMFEFNLETKTLGRKSFTVKTPVLEGETNNDNNVRSFAINVVDDRAKVLLVDGESRWEFRYLDAALSRDERVELTHVLFDQPHLGVLPEPFFPRRLDLPAGPPELPTPFADKDMIIVGDVSPDQVTDAVWQQILKFVSEGGTLVLSAGKRYLPMGHRSPALEQMLPVTKLAPVSLADKTQEATPRLRGMPLQLTADGEQQPMLQFGPDLAQNTLAWKGLPGQMWVMLGEAKPGATVWARTMIPTGNPEGLTVDRKFGVLVHQYVGSGQVVWLGFDATWRWRYRVGDKYHHRFWAQLARWAAANKMSAGNEFVRFGTEKSEIQAGDSVSIRARWTPQFLGRFPNLKSRAEVFRKQDPHGQPLTRIDLAPVKGQLMIHEGRILSLPPGEYLVRLAVIQAEMGDKSIETSLFVHNKPGIERNDVSTNRDLLAQIAEASGGRLFLPDEVCNLPDLFKKAEVSATQYHELTLWDRWPWLLALFTLMMTEWVTRKLNGLP